MIYAILNRLQSDNELKNLLGAINEDTRIYPLTSKRQGTCLVYTDTPIVGGYVKENRLELRIIEEDYDKMLLMEKAICRLLDIEEDQQNFEYGNVNILCSRLVGGGTLDFEDIHVVERFLIFQIKWKEN